MIHLPQAERKAPSNKTINEKIFQIEELMLLGIT